MTLDLTELIDKLPPLKIPYLHSNETIGIDLGSSSIKIVQLKKTKKGNLELVRWAILPLSQPGEGEKVELNPEEKKAFAIQSLKSYRGSGKKIPKSACTSVAGTSIIVRYVKFPKIVPKEFIKNIKKEAESYIPFNIEEVYLTYFPLRNIQEDGKELTETVLVAAKKDFINQKIEILENSGFKASVVDIDAFALEAIYTLTQDKTPIEEIALVSNIGHQKTNFVIIEKGVSVVVKDSPISGNSIEKLIMKNLLVDSKAAEKLKLAYGLLLNTEEKEAAGKEGQTVSDAILMTMKDFISETKKIIQYYATQAKDKKINRLLIAGGTSNIKNLANYLSSELNLPVEKLNPLKMISGAQAVPEDAQTTLAIALGLALRKSGDIKL
ncbi:MAG: type IV pilus assembly protein PilM [Elusimicrobia bacterium]|nr:type IV pilus assembly protein PilM [Elusimicrobiota bacterium]